MHLQEGKKNQGLSGPKAVPQETLPRSIVLEESSSLLVGWNVFRFWFVALVVLWIVLWRNCNINASGGNLKQSMG
jgi:hypothetical protein